ncbi:MAG: hypothetical protein QME74_01205 [Candidatus Edwardsbacteria bacterium]|nr:hypothetical protein [Candidatus Edwardsbacteria bacterium]
MPVKKKPAPRKNDRRKKLAEAEFRRLVEAGKVSESDRRAWRERRKK